MSNVTLSPTSAPTEHEEVHLNDAFNVVALNFILILCVFAAYLIKRHKFYVLPESAMAILVGVFIGGIAKLLSKNEKSLVYLTFNPELFFFLLLPPIIFESGYTLRRKHFFANIGPIVCYAFIGTIISTLTIGGLVFMLGKYGFTDSVDKTNPMEALLFGALISAVDPVATLSIMGSPELQCDQLLYSIVFGESVLNDAVAIVLFKTFMKYYEPSVELQGSNIPGVIASFIFISIGSIFVGIGLGLVASFMYRHTKLRDYPKFETALLFLFCYLCYSLAEALDLSGIMAIFFTGIVLAHYNSYNLSEVSFVTAEQIFATLAVVAETLVFLYMGLSVFTGSFEGWSPVVSLLMLLFCVVARALHIFPLTFLCNLCRPPDKKIPMKMQYVLWFVGLRGAIAFALAENMPGPNRKSYIANTLCICIFTTVVCGGVTEKMLNQFGMKQGGGGGNASDDEDTVYETLVGGGNGVQNTMKDRVNFGLLRFWKKADNYYFKPLFGGSGVEGNAPRSEHMLSSHGGGHSNGDDDDDDDDEGGHHAGHEMEESSWSDHEESNGDGNGTSNGNNNSSPGGGGGIEEEMADGYFPPSSSDMTKFKSKRTVG